jgi:outer membrane protein TolC
MNVSPPKAIRIGALLSLISALLAFAVRVSHAQAPASRRVSLGDAARLAAAQAAVVHSAQIRVDEASARVTQVRSALLPQLSAVPQWYGNTVNSASFGFNFPGEAGKPPLLDPNGQIIGPVKLWDFRASVTQTLFDPETAGRVRVARANVTSAGADVSTASEQAASVAAATYVRALRSQAILGARTADSGLASDLVSIARDQLSAGVGVALDVTRAQSQLASSRAQLIAARNARDRSLLDLRRAVNVDLDTPLQLTDSLDVGESEAPQPEPVAADVAMKTRPDVHAADLQFAAAQQQLDALHAGRLPTVGAFGRDGPTGIGLNHLLNTYTYGVQLTWPAFEGRRREAQQEEQSAVIRELDARRRDLRQQVAADVRGALLDLASTREQVDAARESQRLAEQEVAQARERFRAGVAGNADVVTALFTLNNARTDLIDALTAYQSARVSLARAEGTVSQLR